MAGLTITPATGNQTTTQNPQTVPTQTVGAPTKSSGVQPGTATALLTSQQGVDLGNAAVTTVNLNPTTPATISQTGQTPAPATTHSVHAVWLTIPAVLCLIAVGVFWAMQRSAKSTTN